MEKALRRMLDLSADDPVPMNDHRISDALVFLDAEGRSAATLLASLASIRFAARIAGIPNPVGSSSELVMRAIRRRAPEQRQAAPIDWETADLMAALAARETLPDGSPSPAGLRDAAIIAVISDGLLRVDEGSLLRIGDVERSPDGSATLRIRKHKSSKGEMGGGATLFLGKPTVDRIDAWLDIAGLDPASDQGPLFRRLIKGGRVVRCPPCDRGRTACCRHDVPPHRCCRHPDGAGCVDDGCCVHRSAPHLCCRHPEGDPDCTGRPCCRHLGGCAECPCDASLSGNSIRNLIKKHAAAAGVTGDVNGHSLRVGSAISLARANATLAAIMQAGRWASSDTVARYIRARRGSARSGRSSPVRPMMYRTGAPLRTIGTTADHTHGHVRRVRGTRNRDRMADVPTRRLPRGPNMPTAGVLSTGDGSAAGETLTTRRGGPTESAPTRAATTRRAPARRPIADVTNIATSAVCEWTSRGTVPLYRHPPPRAPAANSRRGHAACAPRITPQHGKPARSPKETTSTH